MQLLFPTPPRANNIPLPLRRQVSSSLLQARQTETIRPPLVQQLSNQQQSMLAKRQSSVHHLKELVRERTQRPGNPVDFGATLTGENGTKEIKPKKDNRGNNQAETGGEPTWSFANLKL
ncbi:uncharacterized protein A1O5_01871 [Cladophialophora psammophila CBS 110553]|uniref:Uncharacterized protein n=1 Tax=Cladophialophora psammophila CBS 110553 TaxID=1182543 RepID=W9XCX1_9EURO|nr:uncharacterized protein A1O5_01871 [Cladophialophora psammophila CBS 110553]EXJ75175.1 hypothetical protein A1O5_01871 [Cladophialophora psammophila CBS 110553]